MMVLCHEKEENTQQDTGRKRV